MYADIRGAQVRAVRTHVAALIIHYGSSQLVPWILNADDLCLLHSKYLHTCVYSLGFVVGLLQCLLC